MISLEHIKRILIVDCDVHHGNGTQEVFYDDDSVSFFSVHRYEPGFYPHSDDGSFEKIGKGRGLGFNINVPFPGKSAGNADYLAVWEHILIPVAWKYKPNLVILKELAGGKILVVLEGGYNVNYIPDCVLACVEELLEDPKVHQTFKRCPS
ncbi:hypothetical protein POM88_004815 [Heracleum sosnowskyi]|uniref:Histone deacetylase domain-containing protein n=1 Tax=Heracleum sosnowskyi TaxID=360622 RepID=A0AAD8JM99_9APIA|nr:hypothetical protein POM88_004811 [Heracleum sosnowskyi]KAK1405210.1 hypothetical protein POM88_004815 [Heracleum sosnowskyi]